MRHFRHLLLLAAIGIATAAQGARESQPAPSDRPERGPLKGRTGHTVSSVNETGRALFLPAAKLAAPNFRNVTVHDPAVIRVDGTIYVFGSHLAAARTRDLVRWTRFADGVNASNPLFDNVLDELEEAFTWSGVVDLWANEVYRLPDGRFAMYYNLSRLDSPRASLGLATAEDVEGPYRDQGILLQSGMNGASEDGTPYDPRVHPNTVDPDLFQDQQGTLWMLYGSYSGGIFLLEMDPDTGRPYSGQGYGRHLMGGNHSRIEGGHVLYSPDTDYYYLFVSFGGLDANGGYNVRVSRSRTADGPYFDAEGNAMADVKSDPGRPLFDDESIEPYAVKLMGGHRFVRQAGEPGAGAGHGYVSPGHSTAFHDKALGRYFLIFHTRFPGTGEFHEVRVHEMFMNADDWPVIAPHRYAPEVGPQVAPPATPPKAPAYRCPQCARRSAVREAAGDWQMIDHGKDISAELKTAEPLRLEADGRVSGAANGFWQTWSDGRITLELEEGGVFQGVTSRGWDETGQRWALFFSALSTEGVALWGRRLDASNDD